MKQFALLLGALSVLACPGRNDSLPEHPSQTMAELGVPFTLDYQDEISIRGEKLSIVFTRVDEDSRCPEGVHCVWAGNAAITVGVSMGEQLHADVKLQTHGRFEKNATCFGYAIELLDLSPYPVDGTQTEAHDYTARLRVTLQTDPSGESAGLTE